MARRHTLKRLRAVTSARRRSRRLPAAFLGLLIIVAQVVVPSPFVPSAAASTLPLCRSTDGSGDPDEAETDAAKNGFYLSNSSRASDATTGIRIEPVFSKRLYSDRSAGFDAAYIAYRITNSTGGALSDVWVSLSGFGSGVVQLANPADAEQQIPSLAAGASITRYFLVRMTGTTESEVVHEVRIRQGFPAGGSQLAGCQTVVKGVQRSIAANPNRVTAIRVTGTPTLGQNLVVEVDGAFGKVGAGSGADLSIMALTPSASSRWPTRALRLESTQVEVRGIGNTSALNACVAAGGVSTGSGSVRKVEYRETLVIRNLSACVTTTKQVYTATYTFRVIGGANTDPVVRPIASISSGTQIKYTGSFPSTEVTIPVSDVTVPATVTKSYVAASATTSGAAAGHVRVQYRLVATSTSGEVVLDALLDEPAANAVFVSATVTDTTRSGATITKDDVVDGPTTRWRFRGPFTAVAGSPGTPVTLTYTVDLPLPGSGSATYDNYGFAVVGSTVISNTATISGIQVSTTSSGTVTTTTISQPRPKDPQTTVFTPPAELGSGTSITLDGYADSGLPLTYTVDGGSSSVCSVSLFDGVWTLTTLSEGTCTLTASQAGDADYAAATSVTRSITVLPGQAITATNDATFGGSSTRTVSVVADSRLKVTLVSINTEVCTLTETTAYDASTGVTIYTATKGGVAGTCLMVANQPGGSDGSVTWGPAPELEVTIGSGTAQTISFLELTTTSTPTEGASVAGNASVSVVAESSANASLSGTAKLPVEFTSLTPAVCGIATAGTDADGAPLSGLNTTTGRTTRSIAIVSAGTCTIRGSQDGTNEAGDTSVYAPATPITRSFTILATGGTEQGIAFTAPADKVYGDASFTITATSKTPNDAGSPTGLRVTFRVPVTTAVCAVGTSSLSTNDSVASVVILAAGMCTIVAEQAGDLTYSTATAVTRSFTVAPRPLAISGLAATDRAYDASDVVAVTGTPSLVGVVGGDGPSAVSLAGSAVGAVGNDGDVGVNLPVSVTGLSLTGTRTADYTLTSPTLSVTISQRAITIRANDQTVAASVAVTCTASVTVGALQGADALGSPTCTPATSQASPGTETITVTSVPIERAGGSGARNVAGNYVVTLATGTLTISSLTIPTLTAPVIEVIYGADVSTVLGTLNQAGGVAAKDGVDNDVPGSVAHTLDGASFTVLDAGTYALDVTFTPTDATTFASASTTRTVTVVRRDLTVAGLSATNRMYDGTRVVTIAGTPSLIALPAGNPGGVRSGDEVSVAGGTGTGTLDDAAAANGRAVTVTGLSLAGEDAPNYTFTQPTGLTVDITSVPLTITAGDAVKVGGEPDPTFTVSYAGFIVGEDELDLTGTVTVTRPVGETAGTTTLTPAGATSTNYAIAYATGTLTIVGLTITVNESGGSLTDRTVTCSCAGLAPGSTATITIFSTPAVIDTVTVDGNGECPGLGGDIPSSVPDGDHTLQLDGVAPDAGSTPVSLQRAVRLRTPVGSSGGGGSGGGGGGGGGGAPPVVSEPEPDASGPVPAVTTAPRRPTVPTPARRTQTPQEAVGPTVPPVVRPPSVQPGTPPQRPTGPADGPASATDSLDLGGRGRPSSGAGGAAPSLAPTATFREVLAASRGQATRQLEDLAVESLAGFAAGTGLRIEVIGARTTARFVLSATERIDAAVLPEVLRRSAPTQAADFAELSSVAPVGTPQRLATWSDAERAGADDLFAASRLPTPVLLSDLDVPADATWLRIELRGATYLPGSTVHLTVTSDPIVLASTTVALDGTVTIVGDLPVEVLASGEHRFRLVGTRVLEGISTDEEGEILLPPTVIAEIERFDLGSDATVRIVGDNGEGGTHTAIRVIPLDPIAPWWTLWVIAVVWLAAVVARRRGRLDTRRRRLAGSALVLASAAPAVILGWLATTTVVVWWGLGLALIAAAVSSAIVPRSADEAIAAAPPRAGRPA